MPPSLPFKSTSWSIDVGNLPSLMQQGRRVAVVGICGLMLVACGKKGSDQPLASKGQVVAHVGTEVVTNQELDNEFRWANIPADKQNDPATIKKVLGDLVLRKYLLQQALASKLDREPRVLLDVLRSREQVLASAYLTRKAASAPAGKADVDDYLAKNPLKFSGRKILTIEQIAFRMGPDSQPVIDANKDAKSLDEIDQQLTSAGVPHGRQMGVLNSGEVPQDLMATIETKKADDVFFIRSGPNGLFFKIKGEEPRPLEGEAAADLARQLLRADALKAEVGLESMTANFEARYEGDYATIMAGQGDTTQDRKK
jgi:EpsD family peptidyl-prolyl cis-trans isomerase